MLAFNVGGFEFDTTVTTLQTKKKGTNEMTAEALSVSAAWQVKHPAQRGGRGRPEKAEQESETGGEGRSHHRGGRKGISRG